MNGGAMLKTLPVWPEAFRNRVADAVAMLNGGVGEPEVRERHGMIVLRQAKKERTDGSDAHSDIGVPGPEHGGGG